MNFSVAHVLDVHSATQNSYSTKIIPNQKLCTLVLNKGFCLVRKFTFIWITARSVSDVAIYGDYLNFTYFVKKHTIEFVLCTITINVIWNKYFGPGGGTRHLHQIKKFTKIRPFSKLAYLEWIFAELKSRVAERTIVREHTQIFSSEVALLNYLSFSLDNLKSRQEAPILGVTQLRQGIEKDNFRSG